MSAQERYPLSWPAGWPRTPSVRRKRSTFSSYGKELSVAQATSRLQGELDRLGARAAILSTNVELRLDGLPRSGQRTPDDPGAAVYFRLKNAPRALACDAWTTVAGNIAALAAHIDALRRIDRYGVGSVEQAFAGYAALPPTGEDWWLVLEVARSSTVLQIEQAYRTKAMQAHPDRGGTDAEMSRLNVARDAAVAEKAASR